MNRTQYFLIIAFIVGLGFGLRLYAAQTSPELHDEDDYLSAARAYREANGLADLPNIDNNTEHPPLVKLLYAAVLDADELDQIPTTVPRSSREELPPKSLRNTRLLTVIAGTLTLLVVAFTNPLAALMLVGQSIHMQFSSVAYLDSVPTLFSALMVYFYTRHFLPTSDPTLNPSPQARRDFFPLTVYGVGGREWGKLYPLLSAICLGIAVAAKYPFAIIGVIVMLHALFFRRYTWRELLIWGMVSIVVFFALNPYLWTDPLDRLWHQATYHKTYADNQVPTYSPLKPIEQLLQPNEHFPDELQSPIWVLIDITLFILMLPGVVILLKGKSVYGWWLVLGMLFLMIYPSQWIQHKMMIVVPYSIAAASGLQWLWGILRRQTTSTNNN